LNSLEQIYSFVIASDYRLQRNPIHNI